MVHRQMEEFLTGKKPAWKRLRVLLPEQVVFLPWDCPVTWELRDITSLYGFMVVFQRHGSCRPEREKKEEFANDRRTTTGLPGEVQSDKTRVRAPASVQ